MKLRVTTKNIAGVVLAAGASSRMGSPKALLRLGEQTFLERLTQVLRAGGCRSVGVVLGHHSKQIAAESRLDGVAVIMNPNPDAGQISSLLCALDEVPTADGLLVVLVDQGSLSSLTVQRVIGADPFAPVAIARFAGQPGHPTIFFREVFDELRTEAVRIGGARLVIEEAIATSRVAWVDVDDPGVIRNINTPTQYQCALRTMMYPQR
jgi:CTP:molybdopterin cytidylyltransferase MocA